MIKAAELTNTTLDNKETTVPVDGLISCRPNLAKIAAVPQQTLAVIAKRIPNICNT